MFKGSEKPKDGREQLERLCIQYNGLVQHHIEPFDRFIDIEMKDIVQKYGRIDLQSNYFVKFDDVRVRIPTSIERTFSGEPITTNECRKRNREYMGDIVVDVTYPKSVGDSKVVRKRNVVIGRLPIMVRSRRCWLHGKTTAEMKEMGENPKDPGGYFIIYGSERVFLIQKQPTLYQPIVNRVNTEFEIKIIGGKGTETTVFRKNGTVHVMNDLFRETIPLFAMLISLNMSHVDVSNLIGNVNELVNPLESSSNECTTLGVQSQQEALLYLFPRLKQVRKPVSPEDQGQFVLEALRTGFLNQIDPDNLFNRAVYLAMMVRKILMLEQNQITIEETRALISRRYYSIDWYLTQSFSNSFQFLMETLKLKLTKHMTEGENMNPVSFIEKCIITVHIFNIFESGKWSEKGSDVHQNNVVQTLDRSNPIETLKHLCRIPRDSIEDSNEHQGNNLACLSEITADHTVDSKNTILALPEVQGISSMSLRTETKCIVALNGAPIVLVSKKVFDVVELLKKERQDGTLDRHVSIYAEKEMDTVHVCSESGRFLWPKIVELHPDIVKKLESGEMSWKDLGPANVLHYLDEREQ